MTYPEYANQPQQTPTPSSQPGGLQLAGSPEPDDLPGTQSGAVPLGEPAESGTPQPAGIPALSPAGVQNQNEGVCPAPWFLGLIVVLPALMLFRSLIADVVGISAGLVQLVAGLLWSRKGSALGRTQARQAASWGLTFTLGIFLLQGVFIVVGVVAVEQGPSAWLTGLLLLGMVGSGIWVLSLAHLVLSVVGGVWASQGKIMPFYGIPFFRGPLSTRGRPGPARGR